MAIRVQTQADINFGMAAAAVVVSHVRAQDADNTTPLIKELPVAIQIAAGAPMRIPSGLLDFVYPAGELSNDHMLEVLRPHWGDADADGNGNRNMRIDLMTDAATPVAVGGYNQQQYANWGISAEAD
ncbi:MAG: hypothetical protein OXC08_16385 [Thiotrichales bacterium]|nr:hypothetical protein [Thiotrichales bacterium]